MLPGRQFNIAKSLGSQSGGANHRLRNDWDRSLHAVVDGVDCGAEHRTQSIRREWLRWRHLATKRSGRLLSLFWLAGNIHLGVTPTLQFFVLHPGVISVRHAALTFTRMRGMG